ncbi:polysaccharide pyruvyl transferase CsaB [Robertmurraya andreesenii]|uniref:Polysaccharide pyruvyl transferase CsaB n=1 Tax=Anoxybacillus andreesenii TaxID=1325932 RepID=A0ABT9UZY0_9BACL|nr:polysaccharide pyruvyl transferase CsaB [Robertmurraya andreesenii]MDQ0154258.1 polysaccharide pyruvyl transferase CsaB [Robertmurraya andreesenii]
MRIVLSGYYGFDNVGDEAILYSIIQALREEDAGIKITVLSNQPSKTERVYGVDAVNRWSMKEVFSALKKADGLISGGGSLLQDETGFRSIPYYTGIMKMAQMLGKPVFVYAQGMGPINKGYNRKIVKHILKRTQITVRDQASKNLLTEIGLPNPIDIVPDPVLGISLQSQQSDWWDAQGFEGPVLTVSVRDWSSPVSFKEKIAKSLDQAAGDGATIVFIPMHGEHDDQTSKEVAGMMTATSHIAPYDASIEEKILMIGQSNLLVGMRLHALIFASVVETPFIALSYDPKIDAFAEISGQAVAGHVNETGWDEHSIYQLIANKLEHEQEEIAQLREKILPLRQKAKETALQALEYFKSY